MAPTHIGVPQALDGLSGFSWAYVIVGGVLVAVSIDLIIRAATRKARAIDRARPSRGNLVFVSILFASLIGTFSFGVLQLLYPGYEAAGIFVTAAILGFVVLPIVLGGKERAARNLDTSLSLLALGVNTVIWLVLFERVRSGDFLDDREMLIVVICTLVTLCCALMSSLLLSSSTEKKTSEYSLLGDRISGGSLRGAFVISFVIFNSLQLVALDGLDKGWLFYDSYLIEIGFFRTHIPGVCAVLFLAAAVIVKQKIVGLGTLAQQIAYYGEDPGPAKEEKPNVIERLVSSIDRHDASRNPHFAHERHFYLVDLIGDQGLVIIRYIGYAIPTLGFIGTVLGLSDTVRELSAVLSSKNTGAVPNSTNDLTMALADAMAPMAVAFDTTLVALPLGLIVVFAHTLVSRWESSIFGKLEFIVMNRKPPTSGYSPAAARPETQEQPTEAV